MILAGLEWLVLLLLVFRHSTLATSSDPCPVGVTHLSSVDMICSYAAARPWSTLFCCPPLGVP